MYELRVQRVLVRWTKVSRGGVMAGRRNEVPRGFAMPHTLFHDVVVDETDEFVPRHQTAAAVPDDVLSFLDLQERDDHLTLLPQIDARWMPRRHRRPPRARIDAGTWLRWSANYRLGHDWGWEYGLLTVNVSHGTEPAWSEFTGEPGRSVEELATLW